MRILILSYHFPPLNVTASQRALAWARYLPEEDIDVTVMTCAWPGDQPKGKFTLLTVEAEPIQTYRELSFWFRWPVLSKFSTLAAYLSGNIDYALRSTAQKMLDATRKHLETNAYDLVMGIYSPHFHIEHAHRIYREYGIPYVIDFRDLIDNRYSNRDVKLVSGSQRILDRIALNYHKKWLKDARAMITVSGALAEVLTEWYNKECFVAMNGFEPIEEPVQVDDFSEFTILHCGTIYSVQRLDIMLRGIELFQRECETADLVFWGSTIHVERIIGEAAAEYAPGVKYRHLPKTSRAEAFSAQKKADVVIFPSLYGMKGVYSSKIFEYLASGTAIILTPGDNDVLEELLAQFDGTWVCNSPDALKEALMDIRSQGKITYERDLSTLTRKAQAQKLAPWLKSLV